MISMKTQPSENTTLSPQQRERFEHYVATSTLTSAADRSPLLGFDGNEIDIELSEGGGPCGGEYLPLELRNHRSGY